MHVRGVCVSCMYWIMGKFYNLEPHLREDIKYYFADFVRKGVTPPPLYRQSFCQKKVTDLGGTPPPLRTKFSLKKSYGFRGYPPSPLYGHLPNFFSLKEGSKNCVLAENTPIFRSKKVTDLGCTPLPTFTDQNFWRKKELQICEVLPHPHYGQNPQISIWCPP